MMKKAVPYLLVLLGVSACDKAPRRPDSQLGSFALLELKTEDGAAT